MNPFQKTLESLRLLGPAPRRFLLFVVFNTISWQVIAGSILILHARAIGLEAAWIGLVMAITPFTMVLSLWTSPWVNRFGPRRLLLTGWTLRNLGALPLVFTPVVYAQWGTGAAGALLFFGVLFFCTMRSLTCVGWFPWLHEIVPEGERGRYFSVEIIIVQVANVSIGLLTFLILGGNPALHKFSLITLLGIAAGLTSVRLITRIPGGRPRPENRARTVVFDLRLVFRDADFRSYALWTSAGMFVTMGQGTLVVLTLRDSLAVSPAMIMLSTAAGAAAAVLAGPWWGRLADRHGSAVVQLMSGWTLGLSLLGLCMLRREICTPWTYVPLVVFTTIGYCGFFVASNRGMLHRMRPKIRSSYASVWLALTSLAAGLSTIIVGQCIQRGGERGYWGTALAYGLLLIVTAVKCGGLPEKGNTLGQEIRLLYEPSRPFWSVGRMCWFVLNPPGADAAPAATKGSPRTTPSPR